ncbi:MAG: hypothetical protein U0S36_13800 [Candidatus Nanopelagicales bacterium]
MPPTTAASPLALIGVFDLRRDHRLGLTDRYNLVILLAVYYAGRACRCWWSTCSGR